MTRFDDVFVPLATKLIDNTFGTSATLRRQSKTFDPGTGKNAISTTDYPINISPPAPYNRRRYPTGTWEEGDMMVMVAAENLTITPSPVIDLLVYGGSVWQVMAVKPIVSGDSTAVFVLQLRQ